MAPAPAPVDVTDAAVIIPTHQRRDLLERTLRSVDALDPAPAEVVVVADGCQDGTEELVRATGHRCITTPGLGAGAARNLGWRATTAPVIAFLDDDCTASVAWLGALCRPFRSADIGLVQGATLPVRTPDPNDRTVWVTRETGLYESCNIAYRRAALEQVGGFDETFGRGAAARRGTAGTGGGSGFGEDTDLAWRVRRRQWATAFASEALVHHEVFAGSLPAALAEEWRRRLFPMLVGEIPELRDLLPGGRWCLRRQSAMAQVAAASIVAAALGRRPGPLLAAVPYLAWVLRQQQRPDLVARRIALDLVGSAALVTGSIEHRQLLL